MSKLSLNINLNAYQDANPTNNPLQNAIRWSRQINSISVEEPGDTVTSVSPGQTKTLVSGVVALTQDGTSAYSLSLKAGTASTYVLKRTAGPSTSVFRVSKPTDADATTQITLSRNGNLVTAAFTAGTDPDFAGNVAAGDFVRVGAPFNAGNQGVFKVLSVGASSFSFENASAIDEVIVLGATFADDFRFFGASGVQAGDKLILSAAFVLAAGTYDVTHAQDNLIEFYSTATLPVFASAVDEVEVYASSKKMIYFETSKEVTVSINGTSMTVKPLVSGATVIPGLLMLTETVRTFTVTNNGSESSTIYLASVE